jgi:hypothetical protein
MIATWHRKLIITNSSTYSNNDGVYNTYSECCTSYKIDEFAMNLTCGRFDNRSNCTRGQYSLRIVHPPLGFFVASFVDGWMLHAPVLELNGSSYRLVDER